MRISLPWLFLLLTTGAVAGELHLWTNKDGRTVQAEFVEMSATDVTIRREDGQTFKVPKDALSDEDLAFAAKADANRPITVKLEVSRAMFSTNSTHTVSEIKTTEKWGYNITVNNTGSVTGQNLRVDYILFLRHSPGPGKSISLQPLVRQVGSEPIPKLERLGKFSFRSATVALISLKLQNGYYWSATGDSSTASDELEGIWVRVYQNDRVIGEYTSAESFRKEDWDKPAAPKN